MNPQGDLVDKPYLLLRTGLVGGVVAALLGPASRLGLPEAVWAVSADCIRCRVASAASAALAAAMLAASSNLSPTRQQQLWCGAL